MTKPVKHLLNVLCFIVGLFFASGFAWSDYKMIPIFGFLMIMTILLGNELKGLLLFAELPMFFIFICKLSNIYSFNHTITIGQTFQYIFQSFTLLVAIFVFIINILSIKKEW